MNVTPRRQSHFSGFFRRSQGRFLHVAKSSLRSDLLWAALVGFGGACAAYLFRLTTQCVHWLLTGHFTIHMTETAKLLPPYMRIIVPVIGSFFAGLVLYIGMHLTRGQSAKDYMEAIRIGDGKIRIRTTLVKSISSLLSIASGSSIGREGPLVQLAAMAGSIPGRCLAMTEERRRLLVACGAAAGIASAYNAPIAGALFVAEIVLGSIAMDNFGPLLFSSVTATVVTRDLLGEAPIFAVPSLPSASHAELLAHLGTGILAGMAAPFFLASLKFTERLFSTFRWPAYVKLGLGGLIVGLLSVIDPRVWGNGYSVVNSILHESWLPQALLIMLALKLLATSASVGSGAVGGVFTPTLFVGAVLGALMGAVVHWLFPSHAATTTFVVVGMGAFLAATTHAPVMAILMLFEMTLDYRIVLPLSLACVMAFYVSSAINPDSIYADSLRGKAKRGEE